ncbi:MAG: hypothetical protein U5N85_16500 [Arcicella sp.]|nr:hypothetical protein [Arcicella sp.]
MEGLFNVFAENFPIADSRENYVLEFVDYTIDPPKYSVDECIDRGLTYAVPLKAKLRLICNDSDNEDFETIEQEVFLGNIPYMNGRGSFVINGAERCNRVAIAPFVRCVLLNEQAYKWYKLVLCKSNSVERLVD